MTEEEKMANAMVVVLVSLKSKPWWVCQVLCDCVRADTQLIPSYSKTFSKIIGEVITKCFDDSTADFCKALREHLKESPIQLSCRGRNVLFSAVIDDITLCLNRMTDKDCNDVKLSFLFSHAVYFGVPIIADCRVAGNVKQLLRRLGEKCSLELHGRLMKKEFLSDKKLLCKEAVDAFVEGAIKREGPGDVWKTFLRSRRTES